MEKFDAIIIGSGQAGNPLAKKLSKEGRHVALVESAFIGGTCINYGCTPTKTLVGLAKNIFRARQASDYGLLLDSDVPNYKRIHQRKNKVVADFREGLKSSLDQDPNITLYHGKGRFADHKEILVQLEDLSDQAITSELIFVNTGSRARLPGIPGLQSVSFYTSKTILELEFLPKQLLIIGGGYIAIEFAQVFQRMGSLVTIIEKSSRLISREDDDVGLEITRLLEAEGVKVITGASVKSVAASSNEAVRVEMAISGDSCTISGTHILVATGRTPNTEDLDLPKTGIRVDEKGFIPVNEHLETTEAGIYALGDVKGGPAFTHVSYHDYLVIADNLFGKKRASIRNRLIPYCIFTDPELGRIGLTEKEARETGSGFSVAKIKTSSIARAIETDQERGFIKAIIDNTTGKILGAAVICANGGELMSLLQVAMMGGLTFSQLRDTMFAHPTYAEAINNLFSSENIKSGLKS